MSKNRLLEDRIDELAYNLIKEKLCSKALSEENARLLALPQLVEIAELAAGLKCLCTGDDHDCQACFLRERIQAILEGKD